MEKNCYKVGASGFMSKGDSANNHSVAHPRRQLIDYAVASGILTHIRVSDDGGEHSVVQTSFDKGVKPSLQCALPGV